jgi:hypothetical protein
MAGRQGRAQHFNRAYLVAPKGARRGTRTYELRLVDGWGISEKFTLAGYEQFSDPASAPLGGVASL